MLRVNNSVVCIYMIFYSVIRPLPVSSEADISQPLSPATVPFLIVPSDLVLAGSLLAGLQLVEVPAADGEVALVIIHALLKAADLVGAHLGLLVRAGLD